MYYLNLGLTTSKVLYVPQGSITKIITHMQDNNIDVSPLDAFLMRFIGMPQQGWINIGTRHLTHADFLKRLSTAKAAMQNVTLIPGETTYIFLEQMAEELDLDHQTLLAEFKKQSPYKEGAFVPDTYKLPRGITEEAVITLLLKRSDKRMKEWSQKIFGTYDEAKWYKYITLASVIQKEAASIEEMPTVGSVIQNRLNKGMKLQMDGALNYGKYSHIKITPKRIRNDKTAYNTYKYKGIPDDPVCNVSLPAIRAAIFPAKTDYLYFMKNKQGKHDFTRYYSTHIRNVKRATK
ncbi:MAG: endolytic transglycosylase MltG [Campylobacterota bacterium]